MPNKEFIDLNEQVKANLIKKVTQFVSEKTNHGLR